MTSTCLHNVKRHEETHICASLQACVLHDLYMPAEKGIRHEATATSHCIEVSDRVLPHTISGALVYLRACMLGIRLP